MADGTMATIPPGQGLWRSPDGVSVADWDGDPSKDTFGMRGAEGCPYVGAGWAMLGGEACRQTRVYRQSPQPTTGEILDSYNNGAGRPVK